jgi:hypothetical protein
MCRLLPLLAVLTIAYGADRWELQYFFDKDDASLTIRDVVFPSATRGVAAGTILEGRRARHVALVTADGGANWSEVKLDSPPISLFFLDESLGWMVAADGIWQTRESGRSWQRIKKSDGIRRVWFLDQERGWAVGYPKLVLETSDGGKTWRPVEAASQPTTQKETTTYASLAFLPNGTGIIAGESARQRLGAFPDWIDPMSASRRQQWPTMTVELETRDSGKTWRQSTAPLFGSIASIRLSTDRFGLVVFRFNNAFSHPSEVYLLDMQTGKSTSVFREKNRLVTDCAVFPQSRGYLAAIEPQGQIPTLPVPGKIKVLRSSNLSNWSEMEVDYRAVGLRGMLAGPDFEHMWLATDTGMILKRVSH